MRMSSQCRTRRRPRSIDAERACMEVLENRTLLSAGSLDSSFGDQGVLNVHPTTGSEYGGSAAVQSDGKIVALVQSGSGSSYGAELIRYSAGGVIDTSFGASGVVTLANFGADHVLIDPNGTILVVGDSQMYRFTASGAVDTSFGNGSGSVNFAGDVAVQSTGDIVGLASGPSGGDAIYRLTSGGSLDTTFGTNGYAGIPSVATSSDSHIAGLGVGANNEVLLSFSQYSSQGGTNMGLVGFTANGQIDSSFGNDGIAIGANYSATDYQDESPIAGPIAVGPDGSIYQVGEYNIDMGIEACNLIAYGSNGQSSGGAGGDADNVTSLTVLPDSEVVMLGTSKYENTDTTIPGDGGYTNAVYLTFFNPNSSQPDTSVGNDGVAQVSFNPVDSGDTAADDQAIPETIAATPGGELIVAANFIGNPSQLQRLALVQGNATTGTVTGTIFNDANGNGKLDSGETGLAGVTVYADLNNNGILDAGEPSAVTNSSGNYTLAGVPTGSDVIIRQQLPAGQSQTTPTLGYGNHISVAAGQTTANVDFGDQPATATITGTVYDDANKDGSQDDGEAGLAGVQVYLDLGNVGHYVNGDPIPTTDANGNYSFIVGAPGNYIVRVVLPSGDSQITPADNYGQHVSVAPNGAYNGENFGLFTAASATGSVSGTVTLINGTTPAGWTVYLDTNNNSKLDSGELSTTTVAGGGYSFSNVPAGAYIVRVITPAGYSQVTPADNYGDHISVSANQGVSGQNFTFAAAAGSVSGTVTLDNGTTPAGWTVYLDTNNNSKLDSGELSTTTVSGGGYSFSNVPAGAYIVRVITPAGYSQVTPADNYGDHITVSANQNVSGQNFVFHNQDTAAIYGTVFNDANGDGQDDDGEAGLAGWSVYLDLDNSGSYQPGDPVPTTNASGDYFFTGLPAGTYIVRVERPAGWTQTSPADNYGQHITLTAGQVVSGVDFEEQQ